MRRSTLVVSSISFLVFLATASHAQTASATYVSSRGMDAGTLCRADMQCRTIAYALQRTNPRGEVIIMDSGEYSLRGETIVISKAVSIVAAPGVYAAIDAGKGDGIRIAAGPTDNVVLRGLTINHRAGAGSGIVFDSGGTLTIESCVVNGFLFPEDRQTSGLLYRGHFNPETRTSQGTLEVRDSVFNHNANGISIKPATGTARATLDHVRLEGSPLEGLMVWENSVVTITNSVASANWQGIHVNRTANSGRIHLMIENCVITDNETGIRADGNSDFNVVVLLSNSTVSGNSYAGVWNYVSKALIYMRSNNNVYGNPIDSQGNVMTYSGR